MPASLPEATTPFNPSALRIRTFLRPTTHLEAKKTGALAQNPTGMRSGASLIFKVHRHRTGSPNQASRIRRVSGQATADVQVGDQRSLRLTTSWGNPKNSAPMRCWTKLIIGVLLIPFCLGASQTLFWVLHESGRQTATGPALRPVDTQDRFAHPTDAAPPGTDLGPSDTVERKPSTTWVPLLAGAACWVVIYIMLPRPMWVYVFGHEVTHVIAAWIFESRVQRFRVSSRGGHVLLSDVNFVIALAPYFVPLYALCIALCYGVLQWFFAGPALRLAFLMLLGAAYAFHVTLTGHALQSEQTDITGQGWLFSVVVIWLGNLAVLIPGLAMLLNVPLAPTFLELLHATWSVWRMLGRFIGFG